MAQQNETPNVPNENTRIPDDSLRDDKVDHGEEARRMATIAHWTLTEKISFLTGASLWKLSAVPTQSAPRQGSKLSSSSSSWPVRAITVADGPHGVRKPVRDLALHESYPATCFPPACALACSWEEQHAQRIGQALQRECLHRNVQIILGPGLNLKRHPAGGRNFEYWSEDPLLTARMGTAFIRGVQEPTIDTTDSSPLVTIPLASPSSTSPSPPQTTTTTATTTTTTTATLRVGACVKHYAVNNQESHRFVVNALVDERTAQELYYRHFATVIREAQPCAVMCAYNKVNGTYCSESITLNTHLLRREWNFRGIVMTDWGATNDRAAGIRAGVDLEMPGSHGVHTRSIQQALEEGADRLTMNDIHQCCQRLLRLNDQLQHSICETDDIAATRYPVDWQDHYRLAYQVAMDCVVLLHNQDDFLPVGESKSFGTLPSATSTTSSTTNLSVALIGDFARDHPRYQGMGSSRVSSHKVVTMYDELLRYTANIHFAQGYHADDDHMEVINETLLAEAISAAQKAEVVILCIGLPEIMESEGFDRPHLGLPAQHNALVHAIADVNPNLVVVLCNGGVVEIPWVHRTKAILEGYLLGEAGGAAIIDLIFGLQSPCGKLAETFPLRVQDIPADQFFPGTDTRVEYREGLNVGYRYFDTARHPVRFPFGHGLSYTSFKYDNLLLEQQACSGGENDVLVNVSFDLCNAGSWKCKEIVQCYIHDVQTSVYRPEHELKDFIKIELKPGESRRISFRLTRDAFSFYDIGRRGWIVENGSFEIRIGASSRDIRLRGRVEICGEVDQASELAQESYPPMSDNVCCPMDDYSFQKRFGTLQPHALESTDEPINSIHRNTLLKHASERSLLGRLLLATVHREASRDIAAGPHRKRQEKMVRANVENLPLRGLVLYSQGYLTFEVLDALIAMMNGSFLLALQNFDKALLNTFRLRLR